ncbi:MAG TPA: helix-turn-helix domain-containing protein [Acidocella sp.]|nr:helix-turn-helix domain-containing protein [Acidocella sp.]
MILRALKSHSAESFHAIGPVRHFEPNQRIYFEGDPAEMFLKVVSGVVRTCRMLSDGRRQVDAFHTEGELFGFEIGPAYSMSAEAVCSSTVVSYHWRNLEVRETTERSPSEQLFSHVVFSLMRAQEHARLLGSLSAIEKIAAFLVEWSDRSADKSLVTLVMTRQDIADYLGLTVETVSRSLTQLRQDGLIEFLSPRQLRLTDITALQALNS